MNHLAIRARLFRSLVWVTVPTAVGCNFLVDAERKVCSTDLDCQNRGPAFAASVCVDSYCQASPRWACALQPVAATITQPAVSATITVISMVDFAGVPNVSVTYCGALDLQCGTPVGQTVTDATGVAPVSVPQSRGYLMVESPEIESYLFFPNYPIAEGASMGTVIVSPKGSTQALAAQLSDIVIAGRGLIVAQVQDCLQQGTTEFASGVSVDWVGNTSGSHAYYALNGVPTGIENTKVTDTTGMAGLLNTPPGTVGIRVNWGTRDVAEASVIVRNGYISYKVIQLGGPG